MANAQLPKYVTRDYLNKTLNEFAKEIGEFMQSHLGERVVRLEQHAKLAPGVSRTISRGRKRDG